MGLGNNMIQDYYCEDTLQESVIGRPSRHQHFALHPKPHDPWYMRWSSTRDMFSEHWDFNVLVEYVVKGGLISALFGASHMSASTSVNTFAANKEMLLASKSTLAPAHIVKKVITKYGSIGCLAGAAYYYWFYLFCTNRGHKHSLETHMLGHAAYGAVIASLFNPRFVHYGLLFGSAFGATVFFMQYGNQVIGSSADTGFVYELPGLSEEERNSIKRKDKITDLSLVPEFRIGGFTKL